MGRDANRVAMTGVRPTGRLHLGNLTGMAANFHGGYMMVADLHALTDNEKVPRSQVWEKCREMYAILKVRGLLGRTALFRQSDNTDHLEMFWLLANNVSFSRLKTMVNFKGDDSVSFGTFAYPVLMAADIALYRVNHVPVGHDQTQHLEFYESVRVRLNRLVGGHMLGRVDTSMNQTRIMDLKRPENKMSKSTVSDAGNVFIFDDPVVNRYKFRVALSSSEPLEEDGSPAMHNLWAVVHHCVPEHYWLFAKLRGRRHGLFKSILGILVSAKLVYYRTALETVSESELLWFMRVGLCRARLRSGPTLARTRRALTVG